MISDERGYVYDQFKSFKSKKVEVFEANEPIIWVLLGVSDFF